MSDRTPCPKCGRFDCRNAPDVGVGARAKPKAGAPPVGAPPGTQASPWVLFGFNGLTPLDYFGRLVAIAKCGYQKSQGPVELAKNLLLQRWPQGPEQVRKDYNAGGTAQMQPMGPGAGAYLTFAQSDAPLAQWAMLKIVWPPDSASTCVAIG